MPDDHWIAVKFKNKRTGETMTLYHPPANGQEVDRKLRYSILECPPGHQSHVSEPDTRATIEALPGPADWLNRLVPFASIPPDKR